MVLLRKAANRPESFAGQLALAVKLARQWAEWNRQAAFCVFLTTHKGGQWFAYDRPDQIPSGAWIVETWVNDGCNWKLVDFADWKAATERGNSG